MSFLKKLRGQLRLSFTKFPVCKGLNCIFFCLVSKDTTNKKFNFVMYNVGFENLFKKSLQYKILLNFNGTFYEHKM